MEKRTAERKTFIFKRLLKIFFILFTFFFSDQAFSKTFNPQGIKVTCMEKFCFTESSCGFIVKLPGVNPEKVQSYLETLPGTVNFVRSKKEAFVDEDGTPSTQIQIYLMFKKAGELDIPPLEVYVNGRFYKIPFEHFTVYENPNTILPKLSVVFEDAENGKKTSAFAGEHIKFTLYINYAKKVLKYDWTVPEDCVFVETQSYDIANIEFKSNTFTPQAEAIASFDWQPLKVGVWRLPDIRVKATAYNGSTVELSLDELTLNVLKKQNISTEKKQSDSVFAYAFEKPLDTSLENDDSKVKKLSAQEMASLRKRERKCFPAFPTPRNRKAMELSAGITVSPDEPNIPILILLIIAFIASLVFTVINFIRKKEISAFTCLFLSVLLFAGSVIESVRFAEKRAVYSGGQVRPIPEENSSSSVTLPSGSCVIEKSRSGKWVYIKSNDTYGWVEKENLIYIN